MNAGSYSSEIVPVILAGGSGTRLWPVSRTAFPKHLTELIGSGSMLQQTARRLAALGPLSRLVTVAAAGQAVLVRRQLEEVDRRAATRVILEPCPRNTAAAVALAALDVRAREGREAVLFVCPSDHLILEPDVLMRAVASGAPAAQAGMIVTFGIEPSRPETGYGYIAAGAPLAAFDGSFEVARFVEKPPAAEARRMVEEGGHLWNSGMFLMRADKVLAELGRFEPELLERTRTAFEAAAGGAIDRDAFARVPSMPIDKAVMERCAEIAVVPCDPRWSDVGSWQALWEIMDKDAASNAIQGDVLLENSGGNLVKADGRLVALAGVHDLAVVETGDAVLVADKRDSEAIKTLVGRLAAAGRREADLHTRELRPWGSFTVLRRDAGFMVREVTLDAGAAIGPQRHAGRAEHWTVVRGRARVTVDGTETLLEPGGTRSVRADTEHRLENAGDVPLQLIEVRTGEEVDDV